MGWFEEAKELRVARHILFSVHHSFPEAWHGIIWRNLTFSIFKSFIQLVLETFFDLIDAMGDLSFYFYQLFFLVWTY